LKLLLVTDAWKPQVNGVVTTLGKTTQTIKSFGHEVLVINPSECKTIPCPTYPEIRLALSPGKFVKKQIQQFNPTHIHIATEGPLGLAARRYCIKNKLAFTTSYHTQFPEYIKERFPIPLSVSYSFFKRFHDKATRTMVGTPHQRKILQDRNFKNLSLWSRGVDTNIFKPRGKQFLSFPRPIWIYVGRVAVEKNIEAFLSLSLPGTKVVIGNGPALEELQQKYPDVKFEGYKFGEELATYIASGGVLSLITVPHSPSPITSKAMVIALSIGQSNVKPVLATLDFPNTSAAALCTISFFINGKLAP